MATRTIINIILILILLIFGIFLISVMLDGIYFWGKGKIDFTVTGQVGDFIGGVIGTLINAAAFYFLYLTLKEQKSATLEQKTATENQQNSFEKERLETRFFEMLEMHRKNVDELKYTTITLENRAINSNKVERPHISEGRKVFKIIDYDFKNIFKELSLFFDQNAVEDIYLKSYLDQLLINPNLGGRAIDPLLFARIDISYSILFLGVSAEDRSALASMFKSKYKASFTDRVIAFAALKPKEESNYWQKWVDFNKKNADEKGKIFGRQFASDPLENWLLKESHTKLFKNIILSEPTIEDDENFYKYYGGHQFRLGHYFRHLFQTVNYINNAKLTYREKYANIKLLRAQLSTFEQRLIFINSLSSFGRIWELEINSTPMQEIRFNQQLITKYNFIKNIPHDEIIDKEISISNFYPKVTLEANYNVQQRIERENLESRYT